MDYGGGTDPPVSTAPPLIDFTAFPIPLIDHKDKSLLSHYAATRRALEVLFRQWALQHRLLNLLYSIRGHQDELLPPYPELYMTDLEARLPSNRRPYLRSTYIRLEETAINVSSMILEISAGAFPPPPTVLPRHDPFATPFEYIPDTTNDRVAQ